MHLLEIHHKCIKLTELSMNHIKQVKLSAVHLLAFPSEFSNIIKFLLNPL